LLLQIAPTFGTPVELGAGKGATLKGLLAGAPASISCRSSKFSGQPEVSGKLTDGELGYSGCVVNKPAKCVVAEPIEATFTAQAESTSGKVVDRLIGSGASEKLAEIEYKNNGAEECSLGNGFKASLAGSQVCEFDGEIETIKPEHEMICEESGSQLKLGGETAKYSGAESIMATNKQQTANKQQE
jgi:hypothetical protein